MAGAIHEKRYATQLKTNKETSWILSTPQKSSKSTPQKKLHYTIHLDVSESISLENDMEINMLEGNLHVHQISSTPWQILKALKCHQTRKMPV